MFALLLLLLSLQCFNPTEAENKGLILDLIFEIAEGVIAAFKELSNEFDVESYDDDDETDWLSGLFDEIVINVCKNVKCGRGECVRIDEQPFYECKCIAPFQPPNCRRPSPCNPSPCLNGGTCVKGRTRASFHCNCTENYSGKFCQVGPDDCYEGNGASYRGFVSETVSGHECLPWNSYLIMTFSPFDDDEDVKDDGTGPHNYCRNPDEESQPWCFIRYKNKLRWNNCNVTRCPEPGIYPPHFPLFPSLFLFNPAYEELYEMQVVLGGVDLKKREAADQTIEVEGYIVHEDFNASSTGVYNDIALLKLKNVTEDGLCARETRYVKSACLPPGPFPDGMECSISGFGVTEKDDSGSTQLLDTKVLLINQSRCMEPDVLGDVLDDSMLCAGRMQGGVDTCQ
ncbi:hypothetical protein QTP70_031976, partial [Hemibagrus guttatus]